MRLIIAAAIAAMARTVPAQAQEFEGAGDSRIAAAGVDIQWAVTFAAPYQVQRFSAYGPDSTELTVSIANADTGENRWKATVRIWDAKPATRTKTCSGVPHEYSAPITVKNHGKVPLRASIEVRYYKGSNAFPAAGTLKMHADGGVLTVTNLGLSSF